MKKVLQVLGSLQRGGAETMIMNVYREIDRKQIQFDFLVKERVENGYEQEVEALGGKIICISSPKKLGALSYFVQVKNVIETNGPYCAVHSHMNVISGLIMFVSFFAGINNRISHSHSTQFQNPVLVNIIGKLLIKFFSTKKVACGEKAGKALFGNSKFTILQNGIDTKNYLVSSEAERCQLRKKLGFNESSFQICHIGRFVDVKNHRFIVELADKLVRENFSCQIHLLGDGENLEQIKNLAQEKGLNNITFYGSINNVVDYLQASDIFILPSKYEGVPLTVIEAQCSKLFCILSDRIPKEVDFNIGLTKYLPLESQLWAEEIINYKENKISIPNNILIEAINKTGFDIHNSAKKIVNLY